MTLSSSSSRVNFLVRSPSPAVLLSGPLVQVANFSRMYVARPSGELRLVTLSLNRREIQKKPKGMVGIVNLLPQP